MTCKVNKLDVNLDFKMIKPFKFIFVAKNQSYFSKQTK